jgi:hypothetical protein
MSGAYRQFKRYFAPEPPGAHPRSSLARAQRVRLGPASRRSGAHAARESTPTMAAWSPIPLGSPPISTGWSQAVLGNLRSIGIVEVRGELPDKVVTATRFYLTSLPADTALFAQALREHWHIENRPHWILDALFREDAPPQARHQSQMETCRVGAPISPTGVHGVSQMRLP